MTTDTEPPGLRSEPRPALAPPGPGKPPDYSAHWLWVLCLLGVDYFSTLSYQPSITYQVAGLLGPLATVVVVLVTLFAALPIYLYVARHSPHGQGSIALLERLVHGWSGKTIILLLLGFAATDFVMLKSISLADAAEHLLHNELLARERPLHQLAQQGKHFTEGFLGESFTRFFTEQLIVTIILGLVSFFFWFLLRKGFNRTIMRLALPIVGLYLLLNGVVIAAGVAYLMDNPLRLQSWERCLLDGQYQTVFGDGGSGWGWVVLFSIMVLPELALGFSGFEMSLIVMPQVKGRKNDDPDNPKGRIANTRKVLVFSAVLMSLFLFGAVLVTTLFIPPQEFGPGGKAVNRALAYLASGGPLTNGPGPGSLHPLFGPWFGSLYDLSTIAILCLAGTSVVTALAALLPRFLLRFGMELKWANRWGVIFIIFAGLNMAVTILFRASVEQQRGAYATGVLALFCSAGLVTMAYRWRHSQRQWTWFRFPWRHASIALLFVVLLVAVVINHPSGLLISSLFIGVILASSILSRALRSDELRTIGFDFRDGETKLLWDSLCYDPFPILVPHRPGLHERASKETQIRADHQLDPETKIVFLEVAVDDPSNFFQKLLIDVHSEGPNFVIKVTQCASVAHAIAAVALAMSRCSRPPGLHFGWSEMDLLAASWSYLAFGEGNVPWKVRELLLTAEPDPARQPRVVIG